ncbi:hypothetical protein PR003_g19036 [Phytophthora rubi]|uniref:RxLR effector protein n=1 Tax=Phytophthora rubi TaxID=129364 RepID=A0A6A3KE53_9STRA|nr:hypothetical protein PR002_g18406 [Phytophthora rubi]KAE9002975.1 hypothetical protein PR001_g18103 [Phytophthora rubi]KAE9315244.1 hypothetical protein PR003_g19036 [Phytophthora rubi]
MVSLIASACLVAPCALTNANADANITVLTRKNQKQLIDGNTVLAGSQLKATSKKT